MRSTLKAGVFMGFLSIVGTDSKADRLIENFGAGADQRWGYVQDGVMGGVSQGTLNFEQIDDTTFARLTGNVSTENNGGFIQFRAGIRDGLPAWTKGLRLRVKGNGETYYVFIRTTDRMRPWHSYRATFETTDDWRNVDLLFASFTASHAVLPSRFVPENITGIGLVAYGRDFDADLMISELHLIGSQ